MKILIIHHLESMWESGYKNQGTNFYELSRKIISHIKRVKYDRVILTQFENNTPQEEHYESEIETYIDSWYEYAYGWESCMIGDGNEIEDSDSDLLDSIYTDSYGNKWTRGGNHSQVVMIDSWMEELKNENVNICGAFDGECIEDLEIALKACSVKYKRIESLIV